jgi:hypothetical protein
MTSKIFPTYNTAIPDQFRIDQFVKEFDEKWIIGKEKMPAFTTVILPNDHGADDEPDAGYPFRESYMAVSGHCKNRTAEKNRTKEK